MRDYTKPLSIDNPTIGKIKGHMRIELTKAATGEKKIIEHDNIFQSALLTAYLRSFGVANNNPFANSTFAGRPLWRNLCGGILLFRDEIQAPANYMPAGNLMVANGAYGVTNNGTPAELGSYNSIESSTGGANSISFVYDWGTSQGNGTISCVCLTSEVGGYIGYGNASGDTATLRDIFQNQESTRKDAHLYYNGKHYRVLSVDYTAKKITYAEGNDEITVASIFQGQNETTREATYTGTAFGNGQTTTCARAISDTEIAIFKSSTADNINDGTTANIIILDVATKTARLQPIINTSGRTLAVINNRIIKLMKDANNHYYLPATSTPAAVEEFDSDGNFVAEHSAAGRYTAIMARMAPGLFGYATDGSSAIVISDGTADRKTNGKFNQELSATHNADYDAFFVSVTNDVNASAAQSAVTPYKNPLYLATINNLDNPVTKDSTQTMKVIYTLTEASA